MRWLMLFCYSLYSLSFTPLSLTIPPSQQTDQMAPITKLKSPPKILKKSPFTYYNIGLSVGGTKIAGAAVLPDSSTQAHESFQWRAELGREATVEDFIEGILTVVRKIKAANKSLELKRIGLAFPGPGDYDKGIFSPINIPLPDQFPIKQVLEQKLGTPVDTLHDGAASVLGETSSQGTLAGLNDAMIVIIGTGIGGGIKRNGKHDYGNNSLGELGYSLWYERPEPGTEDEETFYLYTGDLSYKDFMKKIKQMTKAEHKPVEKRLAGPALAKRFIRYMLTETNMATTNQFLGKPVTELLTKLEKEDAPSEKLVLQKITEGAKQNFYGCYKFIEIVGTEFGIALASYIGSHINEAFVQNIVLVSGVGENFGKGIKNDQGEDLWLTSIRQGLVQSLIQFGHPSDLAQKIARGIIRSKMGHEREILAFVPKPDPTPLSSETQLDHSL